MSGAAEGFGDGPARLLVDCRCALGEGALWHPERGELFWFDIPEGRLFACGPDGGNVRDWRFGEPASAAGWIDRDALLVATASGLWRFSIATGARALLAPLEADRPETRSNDGRADPAGGFWIGTMGRRAEPGLGAIRRLHRGRLETLFEGLTIPNAIAFAPDGASATFTDSATGRIDRVALADGRPAGAPAPFAAVSDAAPDGAVFDAEGFLWNARWDGWCVARHAPDGTLDRVAPLPVARPTCVAFGGPGLRTLYVTTAREGLSDAALAAQPGAGGVFAVDLDVAGLPERRVAAAAAA